MRRRDFLAAVAGQGFAQERRPNILFLMADDLGYADLSCYGRRDYTTPQIDRLAAGGVKFRQAYANSPVCSATRTALMTGRYQYRLPVGLEEPIVSANQTIGLPPEHPTLASLLGDAGYGTSLVGKWHLGRLPKYGPLQSGYERFWGFRGGGLDYFTHKYGPPDSDTEDLWDGDRKVRQPGYMTTLIGDRADGEIRRYAAGRQPFFLSVHFNAPHWPWEAPGDEAEARRMGDLAHYDGGSMETYARMVGELDRQVGRLLATLDETGIAGNTLVVFTSDNGGERFSDTWPFTGKKTELLEGGLRVPAIVRWPERIAPGTTTPQVAITMDWLPTLLAAAGTKPAATHPTDGMNLLPVLTGGARPMDRKLFWRYRFRAQRAMRDGNRKWLQIDGNGFLFDVERDTLERANRKDREPEVFRRIAAEYEQWNAGMLPENPNAYTHTFYSDELADHFGTKRK